MPLPRPTGNRAQSPFLGGGHCVSARRGPQRDEAKRSLPCRHNRRRGAFTDPLELGGGLWARWGALRMGRAVVSGHSRLRRGAPTVASGTENGRRQPHSLPDMAGNRRRRGARVELRAPAGRSALSNDEMPANQEMPLRFASLEEVRGVRDPCEGAAPARAAAEHQGIELTDFDAATIAGHAVEARGRLPGAGEPIGTIRGHAER
jgi:hypothetical protein